MKKKNKKKKTKLCLYRRRDEEEDELCIGKMTQMVIDRFFIWLTRCHWQYALLLKESQCWFKYFIEVVIITTPTLSASLSSSMLSFSLKRSDRRWCHDNDCVK